jgi:hypothetical protein
VTFAPGILCPLWRRPLTFPASFAGMRSLLLALLLLVPAVLGFLPPRPLVNTALTQKTRARTVSPSSATGLQSGAVRQGERGFMMPLCRADSDGL